MELNKFRAGFDFLEMRGEIEQGETLELAKWWETFQSSARNIRQAMVSDLDSSTEENSNRRKRNYRKKKNKASS
jgi:poly(A) polymerase